VVLSPFVWREESIVGCDLQAIHDGEHLSLRLTWEDKTRDAPLPGAGGFADAVALEFSDAAVPVFFGMGSRRHPVHIWYWKPLTGKQLAGDLDRNGRLPGGSRADVPIDAGVAGRPPQRAVALVAHGHVSAQAFGSQDRTITADARWRDGRWTVLLRRKLAPGDPEQIAFTPGSTLQLALAIWNGSTAQRHTDKSFTIWHELRLE
jgi:complex iron-sulfur molybdoenzyme family reductase subunit gamma